MGISELTLDDETDKRKLLEFAMRDDGGSAFPGMTYEQGIMAMLDLMDGNTTIKEIVGEE